jgi:hypothetical protein
LLILATIALWVGDVVDLIPSRTDDQWSGITLRAGMVALIVAVLLRILTPIAGAIAGGRCSVCGRPTERGHTYCLDHLQETVNAGRDQARNRVVSPTKPAR